MIMSFAKWCGIIIGSIFVLGFLVGLVHAKECKAETWVKRTVEGMEITEKVTMTYQYEFFKTRQEAFIYAKQHKCTDNIIHDQDGGYYVFLTMPYDQVFVCVGMSKK